MANAKRPPLSFPELEGRGRRAILRTSAEVAAEEQALQQQDRAEADTGPADPLPLRTEPHGASLPANQNASQPTSAPDGSAGKVAGQKTDHIKVTYRLSPAAVDAIEDAKRILRRRYRLRVSLEEIAEQAILAAYEDLLASQQSSMLARQFTRNPDNQHSRMDGG